MSLESHSALIEQLKPLMMEPNFPQVFEQLTADESNSTRFLLKMELTRLGNDCSRLIDLRDKSELPCEEVHLGRQVHFLDAPARQVLERALHLYRGRYTLGVYEEVMQAHKQRRLQQRQSPADLQSPGSLPFLLPAVVMGSYFNRTEERMNYSIRIQASQVGRETQSGITVDLSVGGARIRLPMRHGFNPDKPLRVKLVDLSQEYYYEDLQQGVDYQIVDTDSNNEYCWMRLKRIGGTEALAKMLGNLINGYKYRYKVDINDVLVTATGLAFERQYLAHLPHLPLFMPKGDVPSISHLLLSHDNQGIVHFFQDEEDISQLPAMLTAGRLNYLLNQADNPDHSLFFCFTHNANGRLFFYSATLAELKHRGEMPLFLGFGASKPSWRVFRLSADIIDHDKQYKSAMIPGDSGSYSALTEQQLAGFSHVLQLMDVTCEAARSQYRQWFDNSNVNALKVYGQKKLNSQTIRQVALEFSERRREARFAFKTLVEIRQGKLRAQGISCDISTRGMQLNLDECLPFELNKPVTLSLPKLQALAGKTRLEELPYQLVRSRRDGCTLHLAAIVGHTPHAGVEFLNKLIEHNREKLEQLTENNAEVKELSDGMKNLLMRRLQGIPLFIEKTSKATVVSHIGVGVEPHPIADLFAALSTEKLRYDLTPLLGNGAAKRDIIDPIREMRPLQDVDSIEIFIQVAHQSRGKVQLKCVRRDSLSEEAQLAFIRQSQILGRFVALKLYRAATGKPDMAYIRRELEYIHIHAQHKAKQLEEQMWRIVGVAELLDISHEVLQRYPALYRDSSAQS
ncbi:PilZ domain-containing protein [Shewanella sedimentimangrovi]|uniref:PilZ domain-containing protein n=1 Tax=Shewanella sedimentimangrovi TaxID=2814293 RepID=A0ABX7R4V6_9GAMM|nr:PilZ domain-containing protein [Shewanella sedimentimangrovi]QSX38130.1 PilZ domain-containing protein [Shewanella sedimentimangrovi]